MQSAPVSISVTEKHAAVKKSGAAHSKMGRKVAPFQSTHACAGFGAEGGAPSASPAGRSAERPQRPQAEQSALRSGPPSVKGLGASDKTPGAKGAVSGLPSEAWLQRCPAPCPQASRFPVADRQSRSAEARPEEQRALSGR